ncbi:MAG: DUF2470 domain-containing protein [Alphaproteobacteria bacterium]|nr:DUF2470 domain-containing protein [Alphaproteobacteria bacterium]
MSADTPYEPTPAALSGSGAGDRVRALLRATDRATLATAQRDTGSWPYASLVMLALDPSARPLLLISSLADHTKNLERDPRASLLIDATQGLDEPLTGARATLMGRVTVIDSADAATVARDRFLRRHPSAELYAGFGDFACWRMEVDRAHLVAGFGDIHWIDGAEAIRPPAGPLPDQESEVVAHMNADHAEAIELYACVLLGRQGVGWRLTGVDAEGADLRRSGEVARLTFDNPVRDAEGARVELVRLVKRARARQIG